MVVRASIRRDFELKESVDVCKRRTVLRLGARVKSRPPLPMAGKMTTQMALRAATLAGACAEALSDQVEAVADALRAGERVRALGDLVESTDRLQRFIIFLELVAELLADDTRKHLVEYGSRLSAALEKTEDALQRRDLARLGLVLAHGLAPALRDYEAHADSVIFALAPARAA